MDELTIFDPCAAAPEVFVLPAYCPIPGMGVLPMSSFLIRGPRPVLVDTGPRPLADELMKRLAMLIDPADLAYLWLTHTDPDHTGAVEQILAAAPRAKLVTTFLGMGKLSLRMALPPERVHLVNPGETLDLGGRQLHALRPPAYDAPETIGAFDPATRTLFAADAFATLMDAPADSAGSVGRSRLREGMAAWAGIDMPWLSLVDERKFEESLETVRRWDAETVLSSHLPPATGMTGELLGCLADVAAGMAAVASA